MVMEEELTLNDYSTLTLTHFIDAISCFYSFLVHRESGASG